MDSLHTLARRYDDARKQIGLSSTMVNLLIALLVLLLVAIGLSFLLLFLRRRRRNARLNTSSDGLPAYKSHAHRRRLTISTNRHDSVYVIDEKRNLIENSSSPPASPVPEIRITFPDEEDAAGKRTSGRVVVVRITDKGGIGLEPCDDEPLPPYQSQGKGNGNGSERFQSLDLERMGGLKEKEEKSRWS